MTIAVQAENVDLSFVPRERDPRRATRVPIHFKWLPYVSFLPLLYRG